MAWADCRRPWTQMSMPHTGGTLPHFGCCLRGCLEVQQQQKGNAEAIPPSPGHQSVHPWGAAQQSTWLAVGQRPECTQACPQGPPQGGEETGHALGIAAWAHGRPGFCTGITLSPSFPGRCSVTPLPAELCHIGSHLRKAGRRSIG